MSTRARAKSAFTLLEVMVAVAIISLLMIGVYRFVKSVLVAVRVSTEATVEKQEVAGLVNFLRVQLEDLPTRDSSLQIGKIQLGNGKTGTFNFGAGFSGISGGTLLFGQPALTGIAHKYNDLPADEMEWICTAGQGLMTTAASGEYRVTLAIQNVKGKASEYEIGLRRRTIESDEKTYQWLPLLRPAAALEIRYFEPRSRQWIEGWQDPVLRPSLVRVRIWRTKAEGPYEAVLPLPTARLQTL